MYIYEIYTLFIQFIAAPLEQKSLALRHDNTVIFLMPQVKHCLLRKIHER